MNVQLESPKRSRYKKAAGARSEWHTQRNQRTAIQGLKKFRSCLPQQWQRISHETIVRTQHQGAEGCGEYGGIHEPREALLYKDVHPNGKCKQEQVYDGQYNAASCTHRHM